MLKLWLARNQWKHCICLLILYPTAKLNFSPHGKRQSPPPGFGKAPMLVQVSLQVVVECHPFPSGTSAAPQIFTGQTNLLNPQAPLCLFFTGLFSAYLSRQTGLALGSATTRWRSACFLDSISKLLLSAQMVTCPDLQDIFISKQRNVV